MPSAAQSFLLLRFLCCYKENEVAVGQPRRFCFCLLIPDYNGKGQQMNHLLPSYLEAWLNFFSSLKGLPIDSPLFSS
jgi:hypothetical protein